MRILFFADNFPPEKNAQASRVYERACYWVNWGHSVTVLTCAPNFPEGKLYPGFRNSWHQASDLSCIRVVRVKTFIARNAGTIRRTLDFLSFMVTAFVAGIFQPRPDLIAATSPQFFAAVAACTLAALRRVPFVMEVSDLWPDSIVAVGAMKKCLALQLLEKIELRMYSRAARIVALTSAFKDNMVRRGVPAEKIDVVINGVDLPRYAPRPRNQEIARQWGIDENDFTVGYVGTHGMAHGLHNILDAAERTNGRLKFLFVGTGAEREKLIKEAANRGLKNVVFIPAQPKERMPDYWSLCNVALVHLRNAPLFQTVIPSKIFEAMGMGLPILLACPKGEASSILERERAGIWVPPEDPDALAQAAKLLEENEGLRLQYSENSRKAAPSYSRERQARDMLQSLQAAMHPAPVQPQLTA